MDYFFQAQGAFAQSPADMSSYNNNLYIKD